MELDKLVFYIDQTYTFQLIKPLNKEIINQLYPDQADNLDKQVFIEIFAELIFGAITREDMTAVIFHTLQQGVTLAYLGYSEEAKAIIESLFYQPWAKNFPCIKAAFKSPTYYANGDPIYL